MSNQYPSSLLIGGLRDKLAERTPGVSRRRRSNSPYQTVRSGARSPAAECALTGDSTSTLTTRRPLRSKPASFVSSRVRLRTKSAEPTSRTIDSATCAATSARAIPAGRRSPTRLARAGLEHRARIDADGSDDRREAEGDRGDADGARREREHAAVDGQRHRHGLVARREQPHEQIGGPGREEQAERAARAVASSNPSTNSC